MRARPTLAAGLWAALTAVATMDAPRMLGGDSDLCVHLRYGARILTDRALPQHDPFLWTTTAADPLLVLPEWGFEVLAAAAAGAAGLAGPLVLGVALATFPVVAVHDRLRRDGVGVWIALLLALLAFVTTRAHVTTRPHLVSWCLVVLAWDVGARGGRARPFAAVALGTVWANLHGGFLIAPVLAALAAVGELLDGLRGRADAGTAAATRWVVGGGALLLGTLANPWGPGLHAHLLGFLTDRFVVGGTSDFAPATFGNGALWVWLSVAPALLLPLWVDARRVRAALALPVLALAVSALLSQRQLPFYGLVGALVAGPHLQALLAASRSRIAAELRASCERLDADDPPFGGTPWRALWAGLLGAALLSGALPARFDPAKVPVGATAWVDQHPELLGERVYTDYLHGGYLLYETDVPAVSLHALNANYPRRLLTGYLAVDGAAPGWDRSLDEASVGWTFQARDRPLVAALDAHPCWERAHTDGVVVVHVRRPACASP